MLPTLHNIQKDMTTKLRKLCRQRQAAAQHLHPSYGALWQAIGNVAGAGGKRVRPYILLLNYYGYGGQKDITAVALAWELLHVGLLIHDDIIDRDTMRHGALNIAGQYQKIYATHKQAGHYATSAALLAGDAVFATAYELIATSKLSAAQRLRAIQAVSECLFAEWAGELIDTEVSFGHIKKVDTSQIAHLKTARYTFVDPLVLGASLAGAPKSQLALLEQLGNALGEGFQLADDLLGVFGDQTITGKTNAGDIHEGKHTMLLKTTLARATPAQQATMRAIVGNPQATPQNIALVREIMVLTGAKQTVEQHINDLLHQCQQLIAQLNTTTEHRSALHDLATQSVHRKK